MRSFHRSNTCSVVRKLETSASHRLSRVSPDMSRNGKSIVCGNLEIRCDRAIVVPRSIRRWGIASLGVADARCFVCGTARNRSSSLAGHNSFVGSHSGNFHWQLGVGGVIPSGTYVLGQLSNVSLKRPAIDISGAITWLDPAIGWDLSAAAGFTFNRTYTATDYKTGDEFHLEWAATNV
jgi:hypothetical protein